MIDQWKYDVAFLEAANTEWNDKLSVHGGRLQLQKGSSLRTPGTPVASDPSIVASHLKTLINYVAKDCFKFLKKSADGTPQFYERIADFKREVDCFAMKACDLAGTFLNDANSRERFTQIYHAAYVLLNEVKAYKATLVKPPSDQRPRKHIHYDERTSLNSFRWHHSKRVPVKETVAAAKKALELARGRGNWVFSSAPQLTDRHMKAYQFFSRQVLHSPVITEEIAQAFEELAPHAELLDLSRTTLASQKLPSYTKISPEVLQRLLGTTCRKIALSPSLAELPNVVEFLSKNRYVPSENEQYTTLYTR